MNTFKHSTNERNKTNVLKLRMKHGAAGYGIYMMLLERLAADPIGRQPLNYDILAYEFRESKELIRSVVEDFDLFIIDLDRDSFAHDDINRQLPKKSKQAAQEAALNAFISERTTCEDWLNTTAQSFDISPQQLRTILHTTFRTATLATPDIPTTDSLTRLLNQQLSAINSPAQCRNIASRYLQ